MASWLRVVIKCRRLSGKMREDYLYEMPRRIPRSVNGDECGAGVRGMQSPSLLFKMPRPVGGVIHLKLMKEGPLCNPN